MKFNDKFKVRGYNTAMCHNNLIQKDEEYSIALCVLNKTSSTSCCCYNTKIITTIS